MPKAAAEYFKTSEQDSNKNDITPHTVRKFIQNAEEAKPVQVSEKVFIMFFDYFTQNEEASLQVEGHDTQIIEGIAMLAKQYSYVIIDCNPAYLPFTKVLIKRIPKMIYVMNSSMFSLSGLEQTLRRRTDFKMLIVANAVHLNRKRNRDGECEQQRNDQENKSRTEAIAARFKGKTLEVSISLPYNPAMDRITRMRKKVTTTSKQPQQRQGHQTFLKSEYEKKFGELMDLIRSEEKNGDWQADRCSLHHQAQSSAPKTSIVKINLPRSSTAPELEMSDMCECLYLLVGDRQNLNQNVESLKKALIVGITSNTKFGKYIDDKYDNKYKDVNGAAYLFKPGEAKAFEDEIKEQCKSLSTINKSTEEFAVTGDLQKPLVIGLHRQILERANSRKSWFSGN